MATSIIGTTSAESARLAAASADRAIAAVKASISKHPHDSQSELRKQVGEFVGTIFYGTLFRQMQQSKIKGKYLHGGRGEEVFQSQLGLALSKRIGQSPNDPIADRIYQAIRRQLYPNSPGKMNNTALPTGRHEQGEI